MTPERWRQIEDLYRAAVDSGQEERSALFAEASPDIRDKVIAMLEQQSSGNILDRPAWVGAEEFTQADAPLLEAGVELGPYRIEGILGAGGMGAVYRAFDSRLSREVAIKTLPPALGGDPERLRRFEQEARAAGTLNHPNILTIYDVGTHDGVSYLVSELLDGETLRARLQRGALPRPKALEYARLIAAGLTAAYERGITHRDLKPENLFLTRDGRLKILDFGLAKFSSTAAIPGGIGSEQSTSTGEQGIILGTVGYMSPEQAQAGEVDHRSDLFNLGAILLEMLTGRRTFQASTPIETLHAVLKDAPQLSDDDPLLRDGLARFLRHCLEKDPRERFQSARDLAFDLEALATTGAPAIAKTSWRKVGVFAVIGLAAILLVARGIPALFPEQPVRFQQITFREGTISSARFTPEGAVVYSGQFEEKPMGIFTARANSSESRQLRVPSFGGLLAISARGDLAITLGCEMNWGQCRGPVAQMPLESEAPKQILDHGDYADFDRAGKLAIVRVAEGRYRLEYPIGTVLYVSAEGWLANPRFSPKGGQIAFLEHPKLGDNNGTVKLVDLQHGNKVTTLTAEWNSLRSLAWSAAGDEVWFSASAARVPVLRAVTLRGKERIVFSNPGGVEIQDILPDGRVLLVHQIARSRIAYGSLGGSPERRSLSWFDMPVVADLSSDGRTLIFYEWGEGARGAATAYSLNISLDGDPVKLGEGKPLALSEDGKRVLAVRGFPRELVILSIGAGEPRILPRSGIREYYSGAWFPDGIRILFAGEGPDGAPRSFIQNVNSGEMHAVTEPGFRATLISSDGKRLAAYGPHARTKGEYYVVNLDGGAMTPIPNAKQGDELIQWGQNGRFLYVRGESTRFEVQLSRIDLVTGRREDLPALEVPDRVGFVAIESGPGAVRMTRDAKFYAFTYFRGLGDLHIAEGLK